MPETNYKYRGIYDIDELGRIQNILDQQRESFNVEDNKAESKKTKIKQFGVIILGSITFLVILNLIIKK